MVCLNTMGQDREYTEEEMRFALNTVKFYGDEWERIEKKNLKQDIDRKLDNMEAENNYKANNEALDEAEMQKRAEETLAMEEGEEAAPMEEVLKQAKIKKLKWDLFTKMFYDPDGVSRENRDKDKSRMSNANSDSRSALDVSQNEETKY